MLGLSCAVQTALATEACVLGTAQVCVLLPGGRGQLGLCCLLHGQALVRQRFACLPCRCAAPGSLTPCLHAACMRSYCPACLPACLRTLLSAFLPAVWQVRAAEMPLGANGAHSWHVLRGFKHSAGRVEADMRAAMHILQGSFDPIMDANNNTDLLPLIIQAKVWGVRGQREGKGAKGQSVRQDRAERHLHSASPSLWVLHCNTCPGGLWALASGL